MMNRSCEAIVSTGFMLSLIVIALPGCGVRPATGGTKGVLHAGAEPLGDIQLIVYQMDSGVWRQVGFGITGPDGEFELLTPGAKRGAVADAGRIPLHLGIGGRTGSDSQSILSDRIHAAQDHWSETDDALTLKVVGVAP